MDLAEAHQDGQQRIARLVRSLTSRARGAGCAAEPGVAGSRCRRAHDRGM